MSEVKIGQVKAVARVDYWLHFICPARSLIKDLIYWPAEIAAGTILFIWILQMDTDTVPAAGDYPEYKVYKTDMNANNQPTRLEMREYGWICLCYTIKHLVYIVDTTMLIGRKFSKPIDLAAPIVNFIMWGLWTLYGFFNAGDEILYGV